MGKKRARRNRPAFHTNSYSSPSISITVPPLIAPPTIVRKSVAGFLLALAVAMASTEIGRSDWLRSHGLSALTISMLLGIFIGNTIFNRLADECNDGVLLTKKWILRTGIVLYGFRLTFQDIAHVGVAGILIDVLMLASTFMLAMFLGIRVFKMDRSTVLLIGAGSAICGAAAIIATEPLARSRPAEVTVAVSTIVVFGSVGMLLYPLLFNLNLEWHLLSTTPSTFGIFIGSTVHELAQVVAAADAIGPQVADTAVIAKMVRVMMLAPFLLILSYFLGRERKQTTSDLEVGAPSASISMPWFAFAFVGVVGINSMDLLPIAAVSTLVDLDTLLLAMAMAALGMTTHVSAVRRAGFKPLALAGYLFIWLLVGGAAINGAVTHFMT